MNKEAVFTDKAPAAIGPYSQAVKFGNFLFSSGQIPIDPATGELVQGDIEIQTKRVLENLKAVLNSVGADFKNVVKTTVFIKDMNEFVPVNKIYGEYFLEPYPARSCVEVARLPKDVKVEIEMVAYLP